MKAIRVSEFGDPGVLKVVELPTPVPAAGQVLLRLHAIGVNPVETYIRSGNYARKPELPYTPGSDGAGIIAAVGEGVTSFKTGERVYTAGTVTGSYAEFTVCQVSQVYRLPGAVSFAQGAAVGIPYATAYRALCQRGQALPGETVLIHGASGGVGIAAVQLARAHGLQVFGTAGTEKGRLLVLNEGAHQVFDHGQPKYFEKILAANHGRGVDLVLEMAAHKNLAMDLALLAPRGRVVVIGSRGKIEIDPRDTMSRDADIRGLVLFNTPPAEMAQIHAALFAGLASGTLRPVIAGEFPLARAPYAHGSLMDPGAAGKIVIIP